MTGIFARQQQQPAGQQPASDEHQGGPAASAGTRDEAAAVGDAADGAEGRSSRGTGYERPPGDDQDVTAGDNDDDDDDGHLAAAAGAYDGDDNDDHYDAADDPFYRDAAADYDDEDDDAEFDITVADLEGGSGPLYSEESSGAAADEEDELWRAGAARVLGRAAPVAWRITARHRGGGLPLPPPVAATALPPPLRRTAAAAVTTQQRQRRRSSTSGRRRRRSGVCCPEQLSAHLTLLGACSRAPLLLVLDEADGAMLPGGGTPFRSLLLRVLSQLPQAALLLTSSFVPDTMARDGAGGGSLRLQGCPARYALPDGLLTVAAYRAPRPLFYRCLSW